MSLDLEVVLKVKKVFHFLPYRIYACVCPRVCALVFSLQDGAMAGQTVPHVHIHVLPRRAGDFAKNDEVYDAIEAGAKHMAKG